MLHEGPGSTAFPFRKAFVPQIPEGIYEAAALSVVVRVHGEHHPELSRVAELYAQLKQGQDVKAALEAVTNHFTAPEDACPTFRKTYEDLRALVENK